MQSVYTRRQRSLRALSVRKSSARPVSFERLEGRTLLTGSFGYAVSLGGTLDADRATSVAADVAGNVYVAGAFAGTVDFDPGPGVFNLTSSGPADAYLAMYNPTGALIWAGAIANAGPINGTRLGLTIGPSGDVYLTGGFSGTSDFSLGRGGSTVLTSGPAGDAFVARYAPGGALL